MRKKKHPKDMTSDELMKHLFHPKVVKHSRGRVLCQVYNLVRKCDVLCCVWVAAISNFGCVAISCHGGQGFFFACWKLEVRLWKLEPRSQRHSASAE